MNSLKSKKEDINDYEGNNDNNDRSEGLDAAVENIDMDGGGSKSDVDRLNHDIYKSIMLNEYVYLLPKDLNKKIDDIILLKLKSKVEGRCIKPGYIMPDSVKILSRSLGMINNANFEGITTYKVKYSADVCNPAIGQIIQCTVGNIDKSQVICYIDNPDKSPVEIYLFKHHHVGNVEFSLLKQDDIINVKVAGNKYEYRDTQIIAIAQFLDKI
jgi:DNA-directed RNA polymerase subunit E'/Rpb7